MKANQKQIAVGDSVLTAGNSANKEHGTDFVFKNQAFRENNLLFLGGGNIVICFPADN